MSQKFSAFWQTFQGRVLKTTFYVSTKTIWELFCKKNFFPSFLEFKGKKLRLFPEKYRRGCQNCILAVHRKISRSFFEKSTILSLSDFVGELFGLFRKSIGGVVKICNYVSIETFRGKKVFFPAQWSFSKEAGVEGKFFGNCQNFSAGLPKLDSIRTFPRKTLILRKVFFISILDIERNSFCLLLTFFRVRLSRSPSTCPLENFEEFFWFLFISLSVKDTDWKKSGFFLKTFRRNCQNCILGVRGKTLRKYFLFKILFFSSFLENEPKIVGLLTNFLWQNFENYILRVQ